jgi:transcriptional regulator with XRE-family HTH domain
MDQLLGRKLRALRERGGLSQAAIAQKVGVTFQQVQKYERGANRISATRLVAFARALEVPVSELLDAMEPEQPKGDAPSVAEEVEDLFAQVEDSRLRVRLLALIKALGAGH